MTGGRLKRLKNFLKKNETFMFTYGDGVSNINLKKLLKFHKKTKKTITVTAVRPPARFGELVLNKNYVKSFKEKPQVRRGWINGGFFVANSKFLNSISGDKEILEKKPLEKASKNSIKVALAPMEFCTDNAAMIGAAALLRLSSEDFKSSMELGVSARWSLEKSDLLYDPIPPF